MFGNAPLMQALAGIASLGKAPASGAALWAKRAKRLSPEGKVAYSEFRKRLRDAEKARKEAVNAEAMSLFEQFGLPMPRSSKEVKEIRRVVTSFVLGVPDAGAGAQSTPTALVIKGKQVASRADVADKSMKVCPGAFGEDRDSRFAANVMLDVLGAGVRVNDRDGSAFLAPGRARGNAGRVFSPDACYKVQVNNALRQRAIGISRRSYDERGVGPFEIGTGGRGSASEAAMAENARLRAIQLKEAEDAFSRMIEQAQSDTEARRIEAAARAALNKGDGGAAQAAAFRMQEQMFNRDKAFTSYYDEQEKKRRNAAARKRRAAKKTGKK